MLNKLIHKIQWFVQVQKLRRQVLEIHTNDQAELERRERVRIAFQNGEFKNADR